MDDRIDFLRMIGKMKGVHAIKLGSGRVDADLCNRMFLKEE